MSKPADPSVDIWEPFRDWVQGVARLLPNKQMRNWRKLEDWLYFATLQPLDEDDDDSNGEEQYEQRVAHYRDMPLAGASDPDMWMAIHHG